MNAVGWVVFIALVADTGLRVVADWLNLRRADGRVPEVLADVYDSRRYGEAQAYLRVRTRFAWIRDSVGLVAVIGFWFAGGFAWLDHWTRALGQGPVVTGLVYIGSLAAARWVAAMPFDAYATFVIEARFGFNRTRIGTFVADRIKAAVLALGLGAPLAAAVIAFFDAAGAGGWWICWMLVTAFALGVQYLAPTWILPLFNRFTPLEDGPLRRAIVDYAAGIGFPLDNVVLMDGSRRSSRANAFFTGFGRHRRIVLFDTLVRGHDVDQLLGVLAHEMGHFKLGHIRSMTLMAVLQAGLMLFLLSFFLWWPPLFQAFFVQTPSIHGGLVFFALLYTPVEFFLGVFLQHRSRKNEMAADRYAAETTRAPLALARALKTLSRDNLSHLNPHPLFVWLNHSHPPLRERIEALEAAAGGR